MSRAEGQFKKLPIKHGTPGGYLQHRRRGEPIDRADTCGCRRAKTDETKRNSAARREAHARVTPRTADPMQARFDAEWTWTRLPSGIWKAVPASAPVKQPRKDAKRGNRAKLTADEVRAVRSSPANAEATAELFGVSAQCVWDTQAGRRNAAVR